MVSMADLKQWGTESTKNNIQNVNMQKTESKD